MEQRRSENSSNPTRACLLGTDLAEISNWPCRDLGFSDMCQRSIFINWAWRCWGPWYSESGREGVMGGGGGCSEEEERRIHLYRYTREYLVCGGRGREGVGGVTLLRMICKQQNCHSNVCRLVDCCAYIFHHFFFLNFSSVLFTMVERLDIFEALNFANGDGGEENDHTDDGMLFFDCKTTPSHPLFFLFYYRYDPRFITNPMTMITVCFSFFSQWMLHAKTVWALNRRQTNSPFLLVLILFYGKKNGTWITSYLVSQEEQSLLLNCCSSHVNNTDVPTWLPQL